MVQGQDFSNKPLAVAYMQDVRGIDSAQSWSLSVLPFLRNTEFFHYQQPGRTTMGAMSRLLWQQGDALRMEVGLLVEATRRIWAATARKQHGPLVVMGQGD